MTWVTELGQYEGDFPEQFKGAQTLLGEPYTAWGNSASSASTWGKVAIILNVATVVLAAAAGISVLPKDVSTWISAGIAFLAAVASGLMGVLNPQGKSIAATIQRDQWISFRDEVRAYVGWLRDQKKGKTAAETQQTRSDADRRLGELRQRRDLIKQLATGI